MKIKFLPQENKFFEYFEAQAQKVIEAAQLLEELKENYDKLPQIAERANLLEKEADEIVHKLAHLRDSVFITPIDREDIGELAHNIDDVVDCIERALNRMHIFNVKIPESALYEFSKIISESAKEIKLGVECLKDLSKNERALVEHCIRINDLEAEADEVNRKWLSKLMNSNPQDVVSLLHTIALKEIVETLETATDECEDVANILETIRVKHL